jgi:hypothetical protein
MKRLSILLCVFVFVHPQSVDATDVSSSFASATDVVVTRFSEAVPQAKAEQFLWDRFSGDQAFAGFTGCTTNGWVSNFAAFSTQLVLKAKAASLEADALDAILKLVYEKHGDMAYLPVAAYRGKIGDHDCWVVLCKWENLPPGISKPRIDDKGVHYSVLEIQLIHIRMFAYDISTKELIGFNTCD